MTKYRKILFNLNKISSTPIAERNAETFINYLSILENTIPSNEIQQLYNQQIDKITSYNGEEFDKEPNLLLLAFYKNILNLDFDELEDSTKIFEEIFDAFDQFIYQGSHKYQNSIKFNKWLENISKAICCEMKFLNFPNPDTINWIHLFQRGLTKKALINATRLDERSIRDYAKKYHAVLSKGIYSIPSVANVVTLELNTSETGELLLSLCRAYYAENTSDFFGHHREKIERISLSVWQNIHKQTKTYLKRSYGKNKYIKMPCFYKLLDEKVATHNPAFINEVEDAYRRLDKNDDKTLYYSIIDVCKATNSGRKFKVNLTVTDSMNNSLIRHINGVYLSDNLYNDHRYISYSKDGSNWEQILISDIKKIYKSS